MLVGLVPGRREHGKALSAYGVQLRYAVLKQRKDVDHWRQRRQPGRINAHEAAIAIKSWPKC